jgi:TonB family protein
MFTLVSAAFAAALFTVPAEVGGEQNMSCPSEDHLATIVQTVDPFYPDEAANRGITGTSVVRVALSETGAVTGVRVLKSSGSFVLDTEAMRVAKEMRYAPEMQACKAVAGSYAVEIEFPR